MNSLAVHHMYNCKLLITQNHLPAAQASYSFKRLDMHHATPILKLKYSILCPYVQLFKWLIYVLKVTTYIALAYSY